MLLNVQRRPALRYRARLAGLAGLFIHIQTLLANGFRGATRWPRGARKGLSWNANALRLGEAATTCRDALAETAKASPHAPEASSQELPAPNEPA